MVRRKLLALALPAILPGATPLLGRWRSATTTRGGIGAVYDFKPTGIATYSSVAIVDSEYRQDGGQLWLSGQTIGVGWHPDGRLQFNHGGNQVEDFIRQGKVVDTGHPLRGEWKGTRMMAGRPLPVTLQFHANGQALSVIYLKTQPGRYQPAAEGRWTLTIPPLPARTVSEGVDELTITAVGGDPHRFLRF
jgi:hypothetical protein